MPNASGNVLGMSRLGHAHQLGDVIVLKVCEAHALHGGPRGVHVAFPVGPSEPVKEGGEEMKLTEWPSLRLPAAG